MWTELLILFVSVTFLLYRFVLPWIRSVTTEDLLPTASEKIFESASKYQHDLRRFKTYADNGTPSVPNTWYHIMDSAEVKPGAPPHYIRACGQNFAVWRTSKETGAKPVIMDAYCPHMGANLAVRGTIKNNCITCCFHEWKFNNHGELVDVPYLTNKEGKVGGDGVKLPRCKPIKTFPAVDWCGILCVYFHADFEKVDKKPEFELPPFIADELKNDGWRMQTSYAADIGHLELSCVDWVDQSGDHCHFHTLHSHAMIPYTNMIMPKFVTRLLGIRHNLTTYLGHKWVPSEHDNYGTSTPAYIYFLDIASLTWRGKEMETTRALTREMYIGPAMMVFHIPIEGVGAIKLFVNTTPTVNHDGTSGGSVMRVRCWLSNHSLKLRMIGWLVVGVSVSQLKADIDIMENKIRKRRPLLTKDCGPWNQVNNWLKQFYSEHSCDVGKQSLDCDDW